MAQENLEHRSTAPRKNFFIPNWRVRHKRTEDGEGITQLCIFIVNMNLSFHYKCLIMNIINVRIRT